MEITTELPQELKWKFTEARDEVKMFNLQKAIQLAKCSRFIYLGFSDMQDKIIELMPNARIGENWWYVERKDTQVLMAINEEETEIDIVFRGTSTVKDWMTDAQFRLTGGVHSGVRSAYMVVADDIRNYLEKLYQKKAEYSIYISGHSLGGGLAQQCASYLHDIYPMDIAGVYTYGSMKIFNREAANNYNQRLGHLTYRCVHGADVITGLPLTLKEIGNLIYIDNNNKIWIDKCGDREANRKHHRDQIIDGFQNALTLGLLRKGHSIENYVDALEAAKKV